MAPVCLRRLVCVAMVAALSGCGASDEEHPAPAGYEAGQAPLEARPAVAGAAAEACAEGVARECKVTLGRQGSVQDCFVGVQLCVEGEWGPCQSPDQL